MCMCTCAELNRLCRPSLPLSCTEPRLCTFHPGNHVTLESRVPMHALPCTSVVHSARRTETSPSKLRYFDANDFPKFAAPFFFLSAPHLWRPAAWTLCSFPTSVCDSAWDCQIPHSTPTPFHSSNAEDMLAHKFSIKVGKISMF